MLCKRGEYSRAFGAGNCAKLNTWILAKILERVEPPFVKMLQMAECVTSRVAVCGCASDARGKWQWENPVGSMMLRQGYSRFSGVALYLSRLYTDKCAQTLFSIFLYTLFQSERGYKDFFPHKLLTSITLDVSLTNIYCYTLSINSARYIQ